MTCPKCRINKNHPTRRSKAFLFRALYSMGVSHCHLCLVETHNQAEEWKERGRLQVCFDWRLLPWRSWRQAKQKWGILCDWFEKHIRLSLIGPRLEVRAKTREAGSQRVLPILGSFIAGAVVLLPGLVLQRLWVRILFLYIAWPLLVCIFSFSKVTEWKNDTTTLIFWLQLSKFLPFPPLYPAVHSGAFQKDLM